MTVTPAVFGPDNIPLVTDLEKARANVGFAVFAAIVHGRSHEVADILETLAEALNGVDIKTAEYLVELTAAGLVNPKAKERWNNLMAARTLPFQSEIKTEWMAEGKAEGEMESILRILEFRGIDLSEQGRERITSCTDQEQLLAWVVRATHAADEADLLA